MIEDQEIRNLHIILVTARCDMSYLISYLTQADFFTMVEIVFQSGCNSYFYIKKTCSSYFYIKKNDVKNDVIRVHDRGI